jgi:hypothetical protein
MALLSFVESAPRAYRLKVSNAAPSISTSSGTIPRREQLGFGPHEPFKLFVESPVGRYVLVPGHLVRSIPVYQLPP